MSASFSVPPRLHGAQRREHDDHAALVVTGAGPLGLVLAFADEALEWRIRLEYRVEMADQQQPLAFAVALVRGDDVARAAGLRHRDPLDVEAERFQLGPRHLAHLGHARKVERTAILVHEPFEQGDRTVLLLLDRLDDLRLRGAQLRFSGGGQGKGG